MESTLTGEELNCCKKAAKASGVVEQVTVAILLASKAVWQAHQKATGGKRGATTTVARYVTDSTGSGNVEAGALRQIADAFGLSHWTATLDESGKRVKVNNVTQGENGEIDDVCLALQSAAEAAGVPFKTWAGKGTGRSAQYGAAPRRDQSAGSTAIASIIAEPI